MTPISEPVAKKGITIYEFGLLVSEGVGGKASDAVVNAIPDSVFIWLKRQCLTTAEQGGKAWLQLTQRGGREAIKVTSYVGVIRAPDGFQIEVLPKIGNAIDDGEIGARKLLIEMLCCLNGFRHIQTDSAALAAKRMPLLEVFIGEFLLTVEHIVKRGLRSDYTARQDNLFALRGKLLFAQHLRQNLFRADRFFTEHDEFTTNRPENRLLHAALRRVLSMSATQANQRLARELCFVFADVPESTEAAQDFQRVRLDRGMGYYDDALAWARLILEEKSPMSVAGDHNAPSLLFPMEKVFEAFVAKHLARQLNPSLTLKTQAISHCLVQHQEQNWFRLKPDLLIRNRAQRNLCVLDTKWKLIDKQKSNGTDKYKLSQGDFYQLHAYGQSYLDGEGEGEGDIVLIYPKTDSFDQPLPVFTFPKMSGLRLWVLPFCLKERHLNISEDARAAMPGIWRSKSGEATHDGDSFLPMIPDNRIKALKSDSAISD